MKKTQESQEAKQDSNQVRDRIRRAAFVSTEEKPGTFKYSARHKLNIKFEKWFANTKRSLNSVMQKPKMWAGHVDWKTVKEDLRNWMINILLEGLIVNFALWAVLKMEFNLFTIFAYGILIDRFVDIYWRLRRHGSSSKIPNKDK